MIKSGQYDLNFIKNLVIVISLVNLMLHPEFTNALSYAKCLSSGWIPYKNEKCVKILNTYKTHAEAISLCQKQLLFDDVAELNVPGSLLTLGSVEEADFAANLLFNISSYTDNVWLGAVRDGQRAQFRWLDGTTLDAQKGKWAAGNPSGDFNENCVEMRAQETVSNGFNFQSSAAASSSSSTTTTAAPSSGSWWNANPSPSQTPNLTQPNPNAFFKKEIGNWFNVACTKHNLVVCQVSQKLPEQVVHIQLGKTRKQLRKLEEEVQQLRMLIAELASNVITDIRFGGKESTDVWQGTGFPDGQGYLVTGIVNWDEDGAVDTLYRRRMQKFVNGRWFNVY